MHRLHRRRRRLLAGGGRARGQGLDGLLALGVGLLSVGDPQPIEVVDVAGLRRGGGGRNGHLPVAPHLSTSITIGGADQRVVEVVLWEEGVGCFGLLCCSATSVHEFGV